MKIRFGRWTIDADREATQRAYAATPREGADRCNCEPCRNFVAARPQVFPPAFLDLLGQLGIDSTKDAEVYHTHRVRPGVHAYGGWFIFVGRIEEGAPAWREVESGLRTAEYEVVQPGFKVGFDPRADLAPRVFRGLATASVHFSAEVPWVIEAAEPT